MQVGEDHHPFRCWLGCCKMNDRVLRVQDLAVYFKIREGGLLQLENAYTQSGRWRQL